MGSESGGDLWPDLILGSNNTSGGGFWSNTTTSSWMKFPHIYLIPCPAMCHLRASPQPQWKVNSSSTSIQPYVCPDLILQFWQQATEGNLPLRQAASGGVGGGPDWQPQRWKERGVCLELPDTLLNRSLHDDGKSWVHMQPFVGKDADSSVASPLQAAETRGRIKSFWVHGVSLLFWV